MRIRIRNTALDKENSQISDIRSLFADTGTRIPAKNGIQCSPTNLYSDPAPNPFVLYCRRLEGQLSNILKLNFLNNKYF